MARKKPISASIQCTPAWAIPSIEQLDDIDPGNMHRHFRDNHEGLRRIRIEPMLFDENNVAIGVIQDFELTISDRLPEIEPTLLVKIAKARAIRYAYDEDTKVPFRVWLEGTSTTGKPWRHQCRVTIDPTITEDYQDAGDEDDEDEDDDGIDGPDVDDDDEEDEEDERVPSQQQARAQPQQPPAGYAPPQPQSPRPAPAFDAEPRTLPPTHSLHPSVEIARQQGIEVKPQDMQVQLSPDFMLALVSVGEERITRMIAPLMKEMRLGMQTIRRESSRVARDSRMMARTVARAAVQQQVHSQKRQDQLEERFIKTCELNYSSYENFQLIAQQGWTAFRNSMEKEAETYVRMREYDRALLGQQLDVAHNTNRTSATGSVLEYGFPVALAIGAGVMKKQGNEEMASLLSDMARGFMPGGGGDQEDEEEDEEVIDAQSTAEAPPRQPSSGESGPAPGSNGSNGHSRWEVSATPAILGTRALLESLSATQVDQLREILPKSAWDAILAAANAQIEQAAIANMAIVKGVVWTDLSIVAKVNHVLDTKQRTLLLKLVNLGGGARPKGRGIPRRPQAAAG